MHRMATGLGLFICLSSLAGLPGHPKRERTSGKGFQTKIQSPRQVADCDPLPAGAIARIGTHRLWHPEGVFAVVFSPDGRQVISGNMDESFKGYEKNAIHVWDVATAALVRSFGKQWGGVFFSALSPDGRTLAT